MYWDVLINGNRNEENIKIKDDIEQLKLELEKIVNEITLERLI